MPSSTSECEVSQVQYVFVMQARVLCATELLTGTVHVMLSFDREKIMNVSSVEKLQSCITSI